MERNLLLRVNALVGALVLSFWANIGWTQRLTWLGTLGVSRSEAHGVQGMAQWWSDGHTTLSVRLARFAGPWTQGFRKLQWGRLMAFLQTVK